MHNLLPEARKRDTVILGLAPDPVDKVADVIQKVKPSLQGDFAITLLADADHKVIARYGLLNEAAAERGRFIPHPTTYVIDKSGAVKWKFTEVNYKIRPTNEMILAELEKLD